MKEEKRFMQMILISDFRFVLTLCVLSILLLSCSENDTNPSGVFSDARDGREYRWIQINGVDWMAEDLALNGKEEFHYYESLAACPEGWQLPHSEDWRLLLQSAGGYYHYEDTIGNPETGYQNLVDPNGFNGTPDARYWTATPSWEEAFTIRSDFVHLVPSDNGGIGNKDAVIMIPLLKSFSLRCRCIRKENISNGSLQFETADKLYDFSDYINTLNYGDSGLVIHAYNLSGEYDEDWVHLGFKTKNLSEGDFMNISLKSDMEYNSTKELNQVFNDSEDYWNHDFEIIVTKFLPGLVEGTLSGQLFNTSIDPADTLKVISGTFSVTYE